MGLASVDLLGKTERHIKDYGLLSAGDAVVIGVSGGADSVCLLHILCTLREKYALRLAVVHVHHGIRGEEADRDARFVEEECRRAGVPCRIVRRNIPAEAAAAGMSEEEAGREARYQELAAAARRMGGAKIAVAHNQNDCAETFLFHAFRGSGLRGLGGIVPCRGNIIRPLLCAARAEIEKYLADEGLQYCTDSTNFAEDYTRNRIRHSILRPAAELVNGRAAEHLAKAAEEIARAAEYIRQQAQEACRKIRIGPEQQCGAEQSSRRMDGAAAYGEKPDGAGALFLSIEEWEKLPEVLKDEVLLCALSELAGSRRDIGRLHVQKLRDIAQGATGRQASLPYRITAQRSYGVLELFRSQSGQKESGIRETAGSLECGAVPGLPLVSAGFSCDAVPLPFQAELGEWILTLRLAEYEENAEIPKNCYTKWFDYDKITSMLTLRTRREGDYIIIHKDGMKKPLKSLFIDRKLPRRERDGILLLTAGSRVLWAVGVRAEAGLYVDGNTKHILVAELRKRG